MIDTLSHVKSYVRRLRSSRRHCMMLAVCGMITVIMMPSAGHTEEDEPRRDRSWMALPAAMYSTDTGVGGGAAAFVSYNPDRPRISIVQMIGLYTQKGQTILSGKVDHSFADGQSRLLGKAQFRHFPIDCYGIGNETDNDNPEKYTPESVELELLLERRLTDKMRVQGGVYGYRQVSLGIEPDGMLDSGELPWAYGRLDAGTVAGVLWDTRDNINATETGTLVKAEYRGLFVQDDGDAFQKVSLDVRNFTRYRLGIIVASMIRVEDFRGDVPFYHMAYLGQDDRLRGYESDRFRGRSSILVQYDLRFPVWGPLGGAVFAAAGRVGGTVSECFSSPWHASAGAGARYYFNREEHLVIRLDYARGEDASGMYLTFGEAF
jgi:outer membrane protein assembly factor BamA